MKVLLFGRNGQVGSALTDVLSGRTRLMACGRPEADLEAPGAAAKMIVEYRPDVVINAAAYTAVDKAESHREIAQRVNCDAVAEIAESTAKTGGWLIHYSTDYVFDGRKPVPYREDDAPTPLNTYGETKLAGEQAALASGANVLVLRTSWVHAPVHRNFIATILRLAAERDRLEVVDNQIGAPTSARLIADVTQQVLAAISDDKAPSPGIYHLAAGGETSWHGLATATLRIAAAAGCSLRAGAANIAPIHTSDFRTAARRPLNSRLATTKLKQALKIDLPHWEDGVRETVLKLARKQAA